MVSWDFNPSCGKKIKIKLWCLHQNKGQYFQVATPISSITKFAEFYRALNSIVNSIFSMGRECTKGTAPQQQPKGDWDFSANGQEEPSLRWINIMCSLLPKWQYLDFCLVKNLLHWYILGLLLPQRGHLQAPTIRGRASCTMSTLGMGKFYFPRGESSLPGFGKLRVKWLYLSRNQLQKNTVEWGEIGFYTPLPAY